MKDDKNSNIQMNVLDELKNHIQWALIAKDGTVIYISTHRENVLDFRKTLLDSIQTSSVYRKYNLKVKRVEVSLHSY